MMEKVASAQRDITSYEAQTVQSWLALIAMCDTHKAEVFNRYLKNLARMPDEVDQPYDHSR